MKFFILAAVAALATGCANYVPPNQPVTYYQYVPPAPVMMPCTRFSTGAMVGNCNGNTAPGGCVRFSNGSGTC